jgi:hypothetical protein
MNPYELIHWAIASGISLFILAVPVAVIGAAIQIGRGKL